MKSQFLVIITSFLVTTGTPTEAMTVNQAQTCVDGMVEKIRNGDTFLEMVEHHFDMDLAVREISDDPARQTAIRRGINELLTEDRGERRVDSDTVKRTGGSFPDKIDTLGIMGFQYYGKYQMTPTLKQLSGEEERIFFQFTLLITPDCKVFDFAHANLWLSYAFK
jgi:hypothetical protein